MMGHHAVQQELVSCKLITHEGSLIPEREQSWVPLYHMAESGEMWDRGAGEGTEDTRPCSASR